MKCSECGGTYVKQRGTLEFTDECAGRFAVSEVEHFKCDQCGDFLFSPDVAREIERAREEKLRGILLARPIGAFISATQAADLLGITRQALHKHRRISRGFIFQIEFGGKTAYLKESVERFKTTGDGRFPLRGDWTVLQYTWMGRPIRQHMSSAQVGAIPQEQRHTASFETYGQTTRARSQRYV